MSPIDPYGKADGYLRLSVTETASPSSTCCMPTGDRILNFEDLLRIVRAAVECGIEKVRITGDEPLARKGIVPFLHELATIPGLKQLELTTTGLLLDGMAEELRTAGVQHLNIRLDSLDEDTYATITSGGDFTQALRGIAAAERAGLPLMLNMVVSKGVNDHEVIDFARLTIDGPVTVRFIESMPCDRLTGGYDQLVPGHAIIAMIAERLPIEHVTQGESAGPSKEFRIAGAKGSIIITTPVSGHACASCSRIEVSAVGIAQGCIVSSGRIDLRPCLGTKDHSRLISAIKGLAAGHADHPVFMSSLGG